MNNSHTTWDKFLLFEKEQKLFDFTDDRGVCPWSLIRLSVYNNIVYKASEKNEKSTISTCQEAERNITHVIRSIWVILSYLIFKKRKYFFFLASKNNIEGSLLDQNSISALSSFNPKDCFLMESYADINDKRLVYKTIPCPSICHFFRVFVKKKYDFNLILSKVKCQYPDIDISNDLCMFYYREFYTQYLFYKLLFKYKGFKKIFVTQNSLQQGMYFAAHQLNIPVYEFQHGIATKAHMAYSYPEGYVGLNNKIYVADVIFTLSPFWLQDCYNPSSKIVPLGNDYFASSFDRSNIERNSMVVVSANVFGENLSSLILDLLNKEAAKGTIYFKLHPNQFDEYDYYCRIFSSFSNVKVVRNELSMQDLLNKVESMLVIQSTAVYEALYRGIKVFIYKKQSYKVHSHVFDEYGVYLVNDAEDLRKELEKSQDIILEPNFNYFTKFNKQLFINSIN